MKKKISFVSLALLAIVAACALAGCTTNELSLAKRIALLEKYDAMSKQSGFFFASKDGKSFLLSTTGEVITPLEYDEVWCPSDTSSLARVKKGGKYGYIDNRGNEVIPAEFGYIYPFSGGGLAIFMSEGKFGYIDMQGNIVIPAIYSHAIGFSEGVAAVKLNGKYGFINMQGETVIPFLFDTAFMFKEGLCPVGVAGKEGFINKAGDVAIPLKYKNASLFSEGIAGVEVADKGWGTIDKDGNEIVAPQYCNEMGIHYKNGRAFVWHIDTTWWNRGYAVLDAGAAGIIDRKGGEIIPAKHYSLKELFGSYYVANTIDNRLYKVLDYDGKEVVPAKYKELAGVTHLVAKFAIDTDGKTLYGLMNNELQEIVPAQYSDVKLYPFINLIKATLPCGSYHIYEIDGTRCNK